MVRDYVRNKRLFQGKKTELLVCFFFLIPFLNKIGLLAFYFLNHKEKDKSLVGPHRLRNTLSVALYRTCWIFYLYGSIPIYKNQLTDIDPKYGSIKIFANRSLSKLMIDDLH